LNFLIASWLAAICLFAASSAAGSAAGRLLLADRFLLRGDLLVGHLLA